MTEQYVVVSTAKCETAQDLLDVLYGFCEKDPRGEEVGQATSVAIDDKYVQIEVREFEDGTRTFVLSGV